MANDIHAKLSRDHFVGTKFGDFIALRPLATGGLATLYLARRASLRSFVQPVAMHVFHPQLVRDARVPAALSEEGRVTTYLEHPGIGRVFDFGEANGTFYVATQYVFGEQLATVLRALQQSVGDARLAPQLIAPLFIHACDALHSAHTTTDTCGVPLRVVHGGLSPSRLYVGYDGSVHVLGFGLANIVDRIPVARANTLHERLPYLAPEQFRDDPVDPRTDVWSLGVMLREVLSGRRLFAGRSATDIIHAVVSGAVPAWPDHVPQSLRDVAERAVQRELRARYPDAQAMGADLRAALGAEDRTPELRMATWMHAFFSERMEEKRALLHDTFHGSPLDLSSQTAAHELQASDSPTLATSTSEGLDGFEGDILELEEDSEASGARSHIRLAARLREAVLDDGLRAGLLSPPALPMLPVLSSAEEVAASRPPPERVLRRYELAIALGALLLGVALAAVLSPVGTRFLRWLAGPPQLEQDRGPPQ